MLDKLKKMMGAKAEEVVQADAPVETVEAVVEAVVEVAEATEVAAVVEAVAEEVAPSLDAELALAKDSIASLIAEVAELKALVEAADAALAAVNAEKAALVADAEAKRLAARKEKIVAAIGTEKADALMTATGSLDDTAFEAVVSALNGSIAAEASSDLFKEVGVAAEADASKVEESAEMRLLKQKYGKK